MVTLSETTVCPRSFAPRTGEEQRKTLMKVTKEDVLGIIEPITSDTYAFDGAIFYCKNWKRLAHKGMLTSLLSHSRCIQGERIPNKTTWLFVYVKDGMIYSLVTNDKYWKKEYTIDAFEAPRHNILVIDHRLKRSNYLAYAEILHKLSC
jgi:hypothetical protein